jgi:hypothetical protein
LEWTQEFFTVQCATNCTVYLFDTRHFRRQATTARGTPVAGVDQVGPKGKP